MKNSATRAPQPSLVTDVNGDIHVREVPTWKQVADAIAAVKPGSIPTLVRRCGQQIRAEGASAMFLIIFRESSSADPLLIGRRPDGVRRGRATRQHDCYLNTTLEYWSREDGLAVFEAFFNGEQLGDAYVLRDPMTPLS